MAQTPVTQTPVTQTPAAQTPAGPSSAADQNFISKAVQGDWRASKLVGISIYGPRNTKIGEVSDVIVDATGSIKAVVVRVGGFLGVGEKNVGLQFSEIKWSDSPVAVTMPRPATDSGTPGPMSSMPIAVPASRASIYDYPDHGTVTLTKEQLKSAPDFTYASKKTAATD
jgi:sporulation protein YlmC with PRC-barrel domain